MLRCLRETFGGEKVMTRRTGWTLEWGVRRSRVTVREGGGGETWSQKLGELPPNVQKIIARWGAREVGEESDLVGMSAGMMVHWEMFAHLNISRLASRRSSSCLERSAHKFGLIPWHNIQGYLSEITSRDETSEIMPKDLVAD